MSELTTIQKLFILLALWLLLGGGSLVGPGGATAATYVFEKDDGSPPPAVLAALDKLNRQGLRATAFEDDTTDGSGETPDQYKVPLTAAKETGLPALVVQAGERVLRTVKAPTTEAQVLEAIQ